MERSKQSLSDYYSIACLRMHALINDMYESLHEDDGTPIGDYDEVLDSIMSVRKEMFEELDLIKSICREFNEIPRGSNN